MRRTLEDIIPPSRRRAMAQQDRSQQEEENESMPPRERGLRPRSRGVTYKPALIALIVIVFAIGALYFLSGARVQIDPMTNTAPLSLTLTSYASTTSSLPFAIVTIKKIASQEVANNGTKKVTQTARGTLTIYNTLPRHQKLIKNTRLSSPTGLIFRINNSVTIPAAHGIIPGSVTVPVYAAAPGSKYNIGPAPFRVPGLTGTSLENKIYAKSTSTMVGGYAGTRPTVSAKTEADARTALQSALRGDLAQSIKQQVQKISPDYILLSGAETTAFSAAPSIAASSTNKAFVRENGVMTAVVFPRAALAKAIESHLMGSYVGQPVTIVNPRTITLTLLNGFPNKDTQVINFTLSGNVTIAWVVNSVRIASAIAGKTRSEANDIIRTFPSVKRAYLTLRPFWVNTFPSDPTKIPVIVNKPTTGS